MKIPFLFSAKTSFSDCQTRFLEEVQKEFVINRGWHEMVLLPDEERAFNEYFKIKE